MFHLSAGNQASQWGVKDYLAVLSDVRPSVSEKDYHRCILLFTKRCNNTLQVSHYLSLLPPLALVAPWETCPPVSLGMAPTIGLLSFGEDRCAWCARRAPDKWLALCLLHHQIFTS
mmetsp:Transcript_102073/g.173111  ORF Transcript_102073/g.173111 Transcript_102073/m.173111 type:complete len:116 (-) Transcript_102073:1280-1627(-)